MTPHPAPDGFWTPPPHDERDTMPTMSIEPLVISPQALGERLGDPDLRLVDTRYYLDGRDPLEGFGAGHLPGAVYMDVERDLTGHPGRGGGRHPLPEAAEFERTARAAGISMSSYVVVYSNGFAAARVWWLLRYFGFDRVALLDGGLDAWPGPLEQGPPVAPEPGDFRATAQHDAWLSGFEEVSTAEPRDFVLLDARANDRFRGDVAPGDPLAGHIPGAINAYWQSVGLDADGRFATPTELRRRFAALGVTDGSHVVSYCGSGVQACHLIASATLAGLDPPRLYVGSWSEYSRRLVGSGQA
jgi:thiosulfate/3-mercaptopyruvate sulfurtransferase